MNNRNPPGRKAWSSPLADLVAPCLTPALAKFGFSEADLLMFWPEIVGERLASRCEPIRMQWPSRGTARGTPEPATLMVRVEGAFALELQHQQALVIERVNTHFGWRCVGRLALRQGPVTPPKKPRTLIAPPDGSRVRLAHDATAGIEEDALRRALIKLGSRVLTTR
ncbi:DUF721 domain-containing protein [Lichenihabitans psoromatis]|uniref:DUF721 domain-containing protein n=1 Tax=Lichenihabitans psoromatis TaxID=2528642 RepID=UPI001035C904|nr:DciA family protein [Lichenihabitans psoromatis]